MTDQINPRKDEGCPEVWRCTGSACAQWVSNGACAQRWGMGRPGDLCVPGVLRELRELKAGALGKCPRCHVEPEAWTAVCPSCGLGINEVATSGYHRLLEAQLGRLTDDRKKALDILAVRALTNEAREEQLSELRKVLAVRSMRWLATAGKHE